MCSFARSFTRVKNYKQESFINLAVRATVLLSLAALTSCAPVMEAQRPTPTHLDQFTIGESRVDVAEALGNPDATVQQGQQSCDIYELFAGSATEAGNGAIILDEAAADVLTLGPTEVVLHPAEALTKTQKHPVSFCHAIGGSLASVNKSDIAAN